MGTTNLEEALEKVIPLVKLSEGLRLTPYKCPAGIWTIGYGTVNKPDGTQVKPTDSAITPELAESWMIYELKNNYMYAAIKYSPILICYPNILAAITDFIYNLGVARYKASTLRKKINDCDWDAACVELSKWVNGGGKKLPGLIKRRNLEIALIKSEK